MYFILAIKVARVSVYLKYVMSEIDESIPVVLCCNKVGHDGNPATGVAVTGTT